MKKKNIILVIGIVMLLVFSGCSEKAEMPNIPENQPLGVMSLSEEGIDCIDWSFEELNEWALTVLTEIGCCCQTLRKELRENKCLREWLHASIQKAKENGEVTVLSEKIYLADDKGKAKKGIQKEEAFNNCFGGDFEKLDTWVRGILDFGNQEMIINMANYNPCFRSWLEQMNLLGTGGIVGIVHVSMVIPWTFCPILCPEHQNCTFESLTVYYDDRDPMEVYDYYCE